MRKKFGINIAHKISVQGVQGISAQKMWLKIRAKNMWMKKPARKVLVRKLLVRKKIDAQH